MTIAEEDTRRLWVGAWLDEALPCSRLSDRTSTC
jgi:hypothetical protein